MAGSIDENVSKMFGAESNLSYTVANGILGR